MKTMIWNLPTRIFHWLLAISFCLVYFTGEEDSFRHMHIAAGVFLLVLLLFRVVYGLFGPRYSHYKDLTLSVKKLIGFLKEFTSKAVAYAGHNPLGSFVLLFLFLSGILCGLSGYMLYAVENQSANMLLAKDSLKDLHELLAHIFLVTIIIHLIDIIADSYFRAKHLKLFSIFSGYKRLEAENSSISNKHKIYAAIWFIIPFIFFYLAFNLPVTESKEKDKDKTEKVE